MSLGTCMDHCKSLNVKWKVTCVVCLRFYGSCFIQIKFTDNCCKSMCFPCPRITITITSNGDNGCTKEGGRMSQFLIFYHQWVQLTLAIWQPTRRCCNRFVWEITALMHLLLDANFDLTLPASGVMITNISL